MILACQNIAKSFASADVLRDITFHIEEHEKAALIGVNGAGKSTLLKIITGEMAPDGGQITLSRGATPRIPGPAPGYQRGPHHL